MKNLLFIIYILICYSHLQCENDSTNSNNTFNIEIDNHGWFKYIINNNCIKVYQLDFIKGKSVEALVDSVELSDEIKKEFIDVLISYSYLQLKNFYINETFVEIREIIFKINFNGFNNEISVRCCYIQELGNIVNILNKYINNKYFFYYTLNEYQKIRDFDCKKSDQKKMMDKYYGK